MAIWRRTRATADRVISAKARKAIGSCSSSPASQASAAVPGRPQRIDADGVADAVVARRQHDFAGRLCLSRPNPPAR